MKFLNTLHSFIPIAFLSISLLEFFSARPTAFASEIFTKAVPPKRLFEEYHKPSHRSEHPSAKARSEIRTLTIKGPNGADVPLIWKRNSRFSNLYICTDPEGTQYVVKEIREWSQVVAEYAGYEFFKLLGFPVPEIYEIKYTNNSSVLITKYLEKAQTLRSYISQGNKLTERNKKIIQMAYYADAILNTFDRHDQNILVIPADGKSEEQIIFLDWGFALGHYLDNKGFDISSDEAFGEDPLNPRLRQWWSPVPTFYDFSDERFMNGYYREQKKERLHYLEFIKTYAQLNREDLKNIFLNAEKLFPAAFLDDSGDDGSDPTSKGLQFIKGKLGKRILSSYDYAKSGNPFSVERDIKNLREKLIELQFSEGRAISLHWEAPNPRYAPPGSKLQVRITSSEAGWFDLKTKEKNASLQRVKNQALIEVQDGGSISITSRDNPREQILVKFTIFARYHTPGASINADYGVRVKAKSLSQARSEIRFRVSSAAASQFLENNRSVKSAA